MKKSFLLLTGFLFFLFSCIEKNNINKTSAKNLNHSWLDSVIRNSDSTYSKPYKRTDFVTAVYYINKKDSSICQVMKDSADSIRQIIISRNNIRSYFAQYYANGHLQANLPLDEFGQYDGTGIFYYEDGSIQSSGVYNHGLKTGTWKVYDEKGKLIHSDEFDKNGQLVQNPQS